MIDKHDWWAVSSPAKDTACVRVLPAFQVTTKIAELGCDNVPVLELLACLEERLLVHLPMADRAAVVTVGDRLGVADRTQRTLGIAA